MSEKCTHKTDQVTCNFKISKKNTIKDMKEQNKLKLEKLRKK